MESLHEKIAEDVVRWREGGYPCAEYPLIKVILAYQRCGGEREDVQRYLYEAQLQALETYWFLRLVKGTPRFMDLYKNYYEGKELVDALSVRYQSELFDHIEPDDYLKKVLSDKEKASKQGIDAVFESHTLKYPSYIFALTMGAGKTVLIGSIIATEFVMSMEYPNGNFMKNALVFAPGTTIIESLRELSSIDYENILPPFYCKKFMANLKIHYTSQKSRTIDAQTNSCYNLIVSNTEKIILRKVKVRKALFKKEEIFKENQRFDRLKRLPALGVFSDEAHHTYGNKAGEEVKRVRKTIDRLHERQRIVCVVNTTGTPYYKKQFLKDVVIWYGLYEGIRDKVLKSLSEGIRRYSIEKDNYSEVAQIVVKDFFDSYGNVALPTGQQAKIAFYFNRQKDLDEVKGAIEHAVVESGESATCLLANTQQSSPKEIDEFHRLNDPRSNKRVVLLVGKGREGWNCPSLFACALITKQTSASNYVLQASARCLRGVAGSKKAARIYLDCDNAAILEKELRENFGKHMSLSMLEQGRHEREELQVKIVKTNLPHLVIDTEVHTWERVEKTQKTLRFQRADVKANRPHVKVDVLEVQPENYFRVLVGKERRDLPIDKTVSLERAAAEVAQPLHLNELKVLKALREAYDERAVPEHHVEVLREQAEQTLGEWEKKTETVRRVLALIHTKDKHGKALFDVDKDGRLFHTFRFSKTRFNKMQAEDLFVHRCGARDEKSSSMSDDKDTSFHYNPYDFDNKGERDTFTDILQHLNMESHEVVGFYFTGSLTDSRKTDIWFEYKGEDNQFHRYFPDFVLYKKSGAWLIIEVKGDRDKGNVEVMKKAKAVQRLVDIQPKKIGYHILYYPSRDTEGDTDDIKDWINKGMSS